MTDNSSLVKYIIANGIIYIGQTVQLVSRRWTTHVRDAVVKNNTRPFCEAIREHGKDAFVVEKIAEAEGQEWGDYLETLYILIYDSTNPEIGYNRMLGGRTGRHTAANKEKISKNSKEWWSDPENKKRASESRKGLLVGERNPMFGRHDLGKPHTEEMKQYLSEQRIEMFKDPEFKERMAKANTGKRHTAEGRTNISKGLEGNQYRKGIPHDSATKERIAASLRATWDKKKSHQAFVDDQTKEAANVG